MSTGKVGLTLKAESFAGRRFREFKKSRNFAGLSLANSLFGRNFIDKTFVNSPKKYSFWGTKLDKKEQKVEEGAKRNKIIDFKTFANFWFNFLLGINLREKGPESRK